MRSTPFIDDTFIIPLSRLAVIAGINQPCLKNWLFRGLVRATSGGVRNGVERYFSFNDALAVLVAAMARSKGRAWSCIRPLAGKIYATSHRKLLNATGGGRTLLVCLGAGADECVFLRPNFGIAASLLLDSPIAIDLRPLILTLYIEEQRLPKPERNYAKTAA